jgi:hypothetical protein
VYHCYCCVAPLGGTSAQIPLSASSWEVLLSMALYVINTLTPPGFLYLIGSSFLYRTVYSLMGTTIRVLITLYGLLKLVGRPYSSE